MSSITLLDLLGLVGATAATVPFSLLVEEMRPVPAIPERLAFAPATPIQYVNVKGARLRYIKTGEGPTLVLLHTLRTQLELFAKVIPELAQRFTVYAVDYPGHGYSDIPVAKYDANYFAEMTAGFLDALDLQDVTLAGVSIGASISLILAARNNSRLSGVVAINPYDYAKGRGMARSSFLAKVFVALADVPVLGDTVMRLRQFFIMKSVLNGGVADPASIPPELLKEMYLVGNRKGHYRAFLKLLRNAETWEAATTAYSNIRIPVLLLWGDHDWSRPEERTHEQAIVPGVEAATIENGGHFLPLDRPNAVIEHLIAFQSAVNAKA